MEVNMAVEIIMPKAGVAMESGTIVEWLKDIGEEVKTGDPILEITTDKVNMEIEAEEDGVLLHKVHDTGAELPVFTVIGYIGTAGESLEGLDISTQDTGEGQKKEALKEQKPLDKQRAEKLELANDAYDIIVLGGGPGGYVAAIKGAMLGGKVALVEEVRVGGTCLNRGCIPTKTYAKNVEVLETIKKSEARGIGVSGKVSQDIQAIVDYKDMVVKTLTDGVAGLLKSHGVKIFNARGEASADGSISLSTGESIHGKKLILATGSIVRKLPIEGIDHKDVLISTEMLDLVEVPKELTVVGGGVIGCEFAEIFNARGSKVTIVEMADRLVPMMDLDLSQALQGTFEKKGIKLVLGQSVTAFKTKGKKLEVTLNDDSSHSANKVLFAVGRAPNHNGIENLNLDEDRGFVKVNDKMETNLDNIYAIGDLVGRSMLAHSASKMGEIAAENAMGHEVTVDLSAVPSAVYTVPEVASVGLTEEEATKKGAYKVGRFNFNGNGRALAAGYMEGFVKVITGAYNEILGVHMYGKGVDELINNAANLMALEIPADEAADLIFGHPSLGEILMESLADSVDLCVHLPKK
jgi:dihydrolipoamide dehydrogenase